MITSPALLLRQSDNNIRSFPRQKDIYKCFTPEVEKNKNSIIIDSEQNVYYIRNVEKVGWGNFFFGINLLYKHRIVKIKYHVDRVERMNLDDIKKLITSKVKQRPHGRFSLNISKVLIDWKD